MINRNYTSENPTRKSVILLSWTILHVWLHLNHWCQGTYFAFGSVKRTVIRIRKKYRWVIHPHILIFSHPCVLSLPKPPFLHVEKLWSNKPLLKHKVMSLLKHSGTQRWYACLRIPSHPWITMTCGGLRHIALFWWFKSCHPLNLSHFCSQSHLSSQSSL